MWKCGGTLRGLREIGHIVMHTLSAISKSVADLHVSVCPSYATR